MYLGARGINTELHAQFLAGANMPLEIFSGNNLLALWPQERQKIIRRKFAKRLFCAHGKNICLYHIINITKIARLQAITLKIWFFTFRRIKRFKPSANYRRVSGISMLSWSKYVEITKRY